MPTLWHSPFAVLANSKKAQGLKIVIHKFTITWRSFTRRFPQWISSFLLLLHAKEGVSPPGDRLEPCAFMGLSIHHRSLGALSNWKALSPCLVWNDAWMNRSFLFPVFDKWTLPVIRRANPTGVQLPKAFSPMLSCCLVPGISLPNNRQRLLQLQLLRPQNIPALIAIRCSHALIARHQFDTSLIRLSNGLRNFQPNHRHQPPLEQCLSNSRPLDWTSSLSSSSTSLLCRALGLPPPCVLHRAWTYCKS